MADSPAGAETPVSDNDKQASSEKQLTWPGRVQRRVRRDTSNSTTAAYARSKNGSIRRKTDSVNTTWDHHTTGYFASSPVDSRSSFS